MKTLKEHIVESLSSSVPKRFHLPTYQKAVSVGRELYAGIAPDMHYNYDSMRPRDGSPPDDSFYSHAVDGITQALRDFHRQNPEHLGKRATPDLIMHVAKHIAGSTEGDDREEHRAALTAHYAKQRKKAAVARLRGEREDIVAGIKSKTPEELQRDYQHHTSMVRDLNPELHSKAFFSDQRFRAAAHKREMQNRGILPNPRSKPPLRNVRVYTKNGVVNRQTRQPFRKA